MGYLLLLGLAGCAAPLIWFYVIHPIMASLRPDDYGKLAADDYGKYETEQPIVTPSVRVTVSSVRPSVRPSAAIPPGDRAAVVAALVASGWNVTQIRSLLRGSNDALGVEVKAARGGSNEPGPSEPGVNPISGRRTSAQFDDLPPLTPPMKMRRQTIDEETGALIYVD